MTNPQPDEIERDFDELLSDFARQLEECSRLREQIAAKDAVIVALADGADKCVEAPHFIVQPFLSIYKKHGEAIAESRAALTTEGGE